MKFIIAIALLFVLAVALMMLLRPSGPRITDIDRRREIDDEDRR